MAPSAKSLLKQVERLQDLGDEMRAEKVGDVPEHSAVAKGLIRKIREAPAKAQNKKFDPKIAIEPDGTPRAYLLNSIRHPARLQSQYIEIGNSSEGEWRAQILKRFPNRTDRPLMFLINEGYEDVENAIVCFIAENRDWAIHKLSNPASVAKIANLK